MLNANATKLYEQNLQQNEIKSQRMMLCRSAFLTIQFMFDLSNVAEKLAIHAFCEDNCFYQLDYENLNNLVAN